MQIRKTLTRLVSYASVRLFTMALMVVVSVFLTIVVANLGGYLDVVVRSDIEEGISGMLRGGWLRDVTDNTQRLQMIDQVRQAMIENAGLNTPFLVRCLRMLWRGLTLDWGPPKAYYYVFGEPAEITVAMVIRDYLPRTLLVFGSANILLFSSTVFLALGLSHRYGSWLDKLVTSLAPLAAAPSWAYGLLITGIGMQFRLYPVPFNMWLPGFKLEYLKLYASILLPPLLAIFLSKFFQSIYAWRTVFMLSSTEDYVEVARAKGLPAKMLESRYILRPVLPNVITGVVLIIVALWQEVIILESVFSVAGIGQIFRRAIATVDVGMIVALVVIFAYLLAITVFLLDLIYAVVDPRVRIGGERQELRVAGRRVGLVGWLRERKLAAEWRKQRNPPRLKARQAGMRLKPGASPVLLLRDQIAGLSASVGRAMHDTLLWQGHRLARIGALGSADEVFWLTRQELKGAVTALEAGQQPESFQPIILERRKLSELAPPGVKTGRPAPRWAYSPPARPAGSLGQRLRKRLTRLSNGLREATHYPGAVAGASIILLLVVVSIYTVVTQPYDQTIKRWRGDNFAWLRNPVYAQPVWVNWFRKEKLPTSIQMSSQDSAAGKTDQVVSQDMREIAFSFPFDYPYRTFPQNLVVFFDTKYEQKKPLLNLTWLTPDGRSIEMGSFSITSAYDYYVYLDKSLQRKLKTEDVGLGLFGDPTASMSAALPGRYTLQVKAYVFEPGADVSADFQLYGQVWGLAGTDGQRRDVMVGLLWGAPIALAFGLLAAFGTTLITLIVAAMGVWYGGVVDGLIQRLAEINLILPMFPVLLMFYTLYSKNLWALLGVAVLLSIFGSSIKNYRSFFLQVKEMPYFEAARAYGASDWRIIFRYMIPRISAVILPQMVILVPGYVFLESGLAILGLFDPKQPPTWGQLVLDGLQRGIQNGAFHLAVEPAVLLLLTGYAFLLLGSSLERVFEPRLRER